MACIMRCRPASTCARLRCIVPSTGASLLVLSFVVSSFSIGPFSARIDRQFLMIMPILQLHFPALDLENGVFRAWWFDPLTASLSFTVFIMWYWYEERKRGLSRDNVLLNGCGYGQSLDSFAAYWIGVYAFKCIIPPPSQVIPDGIPYNTTDVLYLIAEVCTGIVLYDAIMFWLHWAMHELPVLKHWHARHHSCTEKSLEARDTLRHSLMDGSLQVLVNIVVQRCTPWGVVKSRVARVLHNVVVTWMLTESHTSSPYPYIWRRWFVGVREHRLHHMGSSLSIPYGKYHRHQQFFGHLDDARSWWRQRQDIHIKMKQ